jgi:thiamine biosynthesis lipoprotein
MNQIEFHAMGSRMLAMVDSNSIPAEHLLNQVPVWFEEWENVLSRFRLDSELSRLNRSTGMPVAVSQTLWDVFHGSCAAETWTDGLVRPTVLDALLQAGYDRSFDFMPTSVSMASSAILNLPDLSTAVGWDESTHSLFLPESVHLDFGGMAKGWSAQQAAIRLAEVGPALVDAGGDIAISGIRSDGDAWPVGILDPFHPDRNLATLRLGACGVATSGVDYHRWQQDGQLRHHIIDPRTGMSAETDVLTATIIAADAVRAEAEAKAVVIIGSRSGMERLEADPELAGVLILQNGEILYSHTMENFLWK